MIFEGIPCTAPQPHTTHAAQFPGGLLPAIRDAPKLSEPFSVVRLPNFRFFGVKLVGFHRFLVAEIDVSYEIPAVSMVFFGHSIPNVLENQLFTIEMSDLLQKKNPCWVAKVSHVFFLLGILIISRGERGLVRLLSISHPVEASLVFC